MPELMVRKCHVKHLEEADSATREMTRVGHFMMRASLRVFTIDWSGDKRNARRKIWLAEAVGDGSSPLIEDRRSRHRIPASTFRRLRKRHQDVFFLANGVIFLE